MNRTYPHYQDSAVEWLGELPEHWEVKRLKDVGDLIAGSAFPERLQGREGKELPFFKVGDLKKSDDQRTLVGSNHTISREVAREIRARVVPADAVVYAKIGAALLLNRRRVTAAPACIDNNMTAYVPRDRYATTQWAWYALHLVDFGEYVNPGAVPSLSEGDQSTLPIPLPPLEEQRSISGFLDRETNKVDALVAKNRRLIERLEEYRTALISRTVTRGLPPAVARAAGLNPPQEFRPSGVEWLGDVPKHWEVKRLKEVGHLIAGSAFPRPLQGVEGEDLFFFKVGDLKKSHDRRTLIGSSHTISRESASDIGARIVPPNAVVYAKIGAALLLNRRRVTTAPSCIDNNMTAYVPGEKRATTKWAWYVLSLIDFGEHVNPGAVPSLSEGDQTVLPFPLPPLQEQHAIAEFLDRETGQIDVLVSRVEVAVERLLEYRSALITAAVTGKIDVRNFETAEVSGVGG